MAERRKSEQQQLQTQQQENETLQQLLFTVSQHTQSINEVRRALAGIETFTDDLVATVTKLSESVKSIEQEVRRSNALVLAAQQTFKTANEAREQDAEVLGKRLDGIDKQFTTFANEVDEKVVHLIDEVNMRASIFERGLEVVKDDCNRIQQEMPASSPEDKHDLMMHIADSIKQEMRSQIQDMHEEVNMQFTAQLARAREQLQGELAAAREAGAAQFAEQIRVASQSITRDLLARLSETQDLLNSMQQSAITMGNEVAKFRAFRRVVTGT